jgi:FMN phosphatase YigB (HAD superfamily)
MKRKIEAVIFDLGRVLVNIDLEPLRKKLSPSGGGGDGQDLVEKVRESDLIPQLNSGKISLAQFHRALCSRYGFEWSFDFFHQAWCSIFYPSPDMEALVRDLHGRIPLGLLSDTDLSHWTWIRRHYPIVEIFEKPVLSFHVGVCKPDPAMYRAAAQSVGTPPERCFYTDDLPGNIEGARSAGMSAVLFQNADQIRQELKKYEIL